MQNSILKYLGLFKGLCFAACIFVCPLIFLTDTTQNPFAVQPLFLSIFGGVFLFSCLLEMALKKTIDLKFSKIDFALFIFLFLGFVSLIYNYFFTPYQTAFLNEFARKADYLFLGLIFGFLFAKITSLKINFNSDSYEFFKKIFLWCLLWLLWKVQANIFIAVLIFGGGVYLCFAHLKNYGIKECFDIILAVCFCACLYGLLQALGLDLFFRNLDITKEFGVRPVSTFGNPNFLASFTLLCLPYSLLLFFKAKGWKHIIISAFIVLVLTSFLVLSGTRSAWLGLLGSAVIFLVFFCDFRKIFIKNIFKIFAVLAILVLCLYSAKDFIKTSSATAPIARITEAKQALKLKDISLKNKDLIAPLHQRLMMWHCALENFKENPILGKGLNSFQLYFPFCQGKLLAENTALDKIQIQANAAHNEYLEILSEGGILLFAAYIVLWAIFFFTVVKAIKKLETDEKVFYLVLLFALISVLIDNTLNITLRTLLVSFVFWFTFSALNNLNATVKKFNFKPVYSSVVCILVCVVLGGVISVYVKQFLAQKYELSGYKYLLNRDYKSSTEEMEKAAKTSAFRPEPFYFLVNLNIERNNLKEALNSANKAVEFYPAYYEMYARLAALYNAQNETPLALDALRKTLALLPTYTPAAELYGSILSKQKNVADDDKKNLLNLSAILPFEVNLTSYLAEIYFKENDCSNSSYLAISTLQKNMFDKTALRILLACPQNQDEELFAQDVKQLNELKERIKNKKDVKILWDLENLLQSNPQDFWISNLLAEFYFRQNNFCRAAEILRDVKPKGNLNKSYNFSLAFTTEKCGNKQEAKQLFEEVLSFDPYDEFAKNGLKNVKI